MLNDIILTATLVLQLKAGAVIGSASGFFYEKGDGLYLVTNQHVVKGSDGAAPDTLRLRLHVDAKDISKNDSFEVPLYADGRPVWKINPQQRDADIAVVKLDRAQLKGRFIVKAWSSDGFLPQKYVLQPGEDVFIMGYPLGFHDQSHNLPIFRDAMVASAYRVPFEGKPLFLTDANLHPGTSGSAVITKPKNIWVDDKGNADIKTGTVYYLVGVHSATLDLKGNKGQPLGLGAAWYAELIEDIVSQF